MGGRFGKLEVSLNGDELESLERLVQADLPPWGPYGISGVFEAFEGRRYKGEINVEVGTSALEGSLDATLGEPLRAEVTLAATSVQLDDFDTQGWSLAGRSKSRNPSKRRESLRPETATAGQRSSAPRSSGARTGPYRYRSTRSPPVRIASARATSHSPSTVGASAWSRSSSKCRVARLT